MDLQRTQAGGFRYRIPSSLRYSGEFPEKHPILEQLWDAKRKEQTAKSWRRPDREVPRNRFQRQSIFPVGRHFVVEPGGVPATRELVHHAGSAVILPRFRDGKILLVRQFRLAAGRSLWELPAEAIDRGETVLHAAKRELVEETGYGSSFWRRLVEFYPSPGFLDEKMTVFLAQDIRPGPPRPEKDERILVRSFRMAELLLMMQTGKIRDGKSLIGLLYFRWLSS